MVQKIFSTSFLLLGISTLSAKPFTAPHAIEAFTTTLCISDKKNPQATPFIHTFKASTLVGLSDQVQNFVSQFCEGKENLRITVWCTVLTKKGKVVDRLKGASLTWCRNKNKKLLSAKAYETQKKHSLTKLKRLIQQAYSSSLKARIKNFMTNHWLLGPVVMGIALVVTTVVGFFFIGAPLLAWLGVSNIALGNAAFVFVIVTTEITTILPVILVIGVAITGAEYLLHHHSAPQLSPSYQPHIPLSE